MKRALLVVCIVIAAAVAVWQAGVGGVEAQPALSWALAGKTVLLDPGHGGDDPGVVAADGTKEKDLNLAISRHLAEILRQAGATVLLSRENDQAVQADKRADLDRRLAMMTDSGSCLCVSIHANSFPRQPSVRGAQVFYNQADVSGQRLAELAQGYLNQLTGAQRSALAHPSAYLLKHNQIPTALVEVGFFSNPQELAQLADDEYRWQLAWAVYQGIVEFFIE